MFTKNKKIERLMFPFVQVLNCKPFTSSLFPLLSVGIVVGPCKYQRKFTYEKVRKGIHVCVRLWVRSFFFFFKYDI